MVRIRPTAAESLRLDGQLGPPLCCIPWLGATDSADAIDWRGTKAEAPDGGKRQPVQPWLRAPVRASCVRLVPAARADAEARLGRERVVVVVGVGALLGGGDVELREVRRALRALHAPEEVPAGD